MQLLGDFTQGELARASGVSATTILLFFSGKRKPRPTLVVKIMLGLECVFAQNG